MPVRCELLWVNRLFPWEVIGRTGDGDGGLWGVSIFFGTCFCVLIFDFLFFSFLSALAFVLFVFASSLSADFTCGLFFFLSGGPFLFYFGETTGDRDGVLHCFVFVMRVDLFFFLFSFFFSRLLRHPTIVINHATIISTPFFHSHLYLCMYRPQIA